MKWCDKGADHRGPYFTLIAVATEVGPQTRVGNRKRRIGRRTVARLCQTCLRMAEFRLEGQDMLVSMAQDPTND